jgi:glycine betaine/proline transport system permease protein
MAVVAVPIPPPARRVSRRWLVLVVPVGIIAVLCVVRSLGGSNAPTWFDVPSWLDARIRPRLDEAYHWITINSGRHWIFTDLFNPIADALESLFDAILWVLRSLRWPGVLMLAALIGWRTGGWRAALTGTLCLAACGALKLWDDTMIAMGIMLVAVALSLLVGIPLGVVAGRSNRADRTFRIFLDAAQVVPTYSYFLVALALLGIGVPPAIVATAIFAVAPAVRLTSLGIRNVPAVATEVGTSFGSTSWQLLTKVQLPMARRSILLGLNQVIMMAFGVVVIGALAGTGGLGQQVLAGLQKVDVGRAFIPGLALVLAAVSLDRITTGEAGHRHRPGLGQQIRHTVQRHPLRAAGVAAGIVVATGLVAKLAGAAREFPSALTLNTRNLAQWTTNVVDWVNRNFRHGVPIVGGTGSFSDFLVIHVLDPIRNVLWGAPWWLIVIGFGVIAFLSGGPRLAAITVGCLVALASLGTWDLAMDTLSQVIVVLILAVLIAIPFGIWAGRSDRAYRLMRPVLDAGQVLPPFVYLVPVIFLFNAGRVPGIIASVVYAVPPAVRIISLGLRGVPVEMREAAVSFGATGTQELAKVQIPAAARSMMLGINQIIMMALSMVVIAGLVGGGALGLETVYGFTKGEVGRGLVGGLSIVLLAVVLDRITQSWGAGSDDTTRGRP